MRNVFFQRPGAANNRLTDTRRRLVLLIAAIYRPPRIGNMPRECAPGRKDDPSNVEGWKMIRLSAR